MAGAKTLLDYNPKLTEECMQVLALLLSGIGEWRKSIVLVGGLTPEILVKAKPPEVPPYTGTGDIDLVMDLAIMADPDAYSTFEEALLSQGFRPLGPEDKPSWKWEFTTDSKTKIRIEFLADDPNMGGGKPKSIPEHGRLAACNIHHSSIVFDLYETEIITAELPGGRGVTKQEIRHADIVGFTVLKIFAFRSRAEGKDAHDLVYCLQHGELSIPDIAVRFVAALKDKHGEIIELALTDLASTFGDEEGLEGYRKDGPARAALFEIAGDSQEDRDRRLVRQRDFAGVVNKLLAEITARR